MFPLATDLNVRDDLKNFTVEQIQQIQRDSTLPFSVAAINLNGDLNLGVMIRSAVLFGAERMFVIGRRKFDRRSTVGCHNYIDLVVVESELDETGISRSALDDVLGDHGYTPVFIEQGGVAVQSFDFESVHPKPCLVFGNEGYGMSLEFMGNSPRVSIAQRGVSRSLNVAAAAAITIFTCSNQLANVPQYKPFGM